VAIIGSREQVCSTSSQARNPHRTMALELFPARPAFAGGVRQKMARHGKLPTRFPIEGWNSIAAKWAWAAREGCQLYKQAAASLSLSLSNGQQASTIAVCGPSNLYICQRRWRISATAISVDAYLLGSLS
jgi:hypothetical protein